MELPVMIKAEQDLKYYGNRGVRSPGEKFCFLKEK